MGFNRRKEDEHHRLRRQALRWALDHGEALKQTEPEMPPNFDNRLGDNWRLLFAIADLAGGEWPERARQAAKTLSGTIDAASIGTRILAAIKTAFDGADAIGSADLVARLTAEPDAEWAEWKAGKPMTQAQLARVLKPFGIAPMQVRIGGQQVRGYQRSQFEDAWSRYL